VAVGEPRNWGEEAGRRLIAIFAAMESEVAACPEWTRFGERKVVGGATVIEGDGAFVCQTGIGRERAQQAAAGVLSELAPLVVLTVGVAGGLSPGIAVGDVVVCTHVDHESHRQSGIERAIYSDQRLLDAALEVARERNTPVLTGSSITVDEAAWGPAEKATHHAWKAHDIVEMESFWIAEAAVKRGIPFLAVRSVSDSSADAIPNLGVVRPDGTLDAEKFVAHLREHPETGEQLSKLAQNTKAALTSLAAFLEVLAPSLLARTGASR
jgi:adenosylhomocysteine nucleosidase